MRIAFILLLYLLPIKIMAVEIERDDCVTGTIVNSEVSFVDLCVLNYSRYVLELRQFAKERLISRSQATFEPVNIKQNSRNTIKIRFGLQTIKIKANSSAPVLLILNRPFRGGELGFPHQDLFHPYTNSRNGLWGLLESICLGKSKYDITNIKGLTPRKFREISSFARTRFAFYKGNCKLAPLYELKLGD